MAESLYPPSSRELAEKRRTFAPRDQVFSRRVFADGTLPAKTKQLIAVAVAHVTRAHIAFGFTGRGGTPRGRVRGSPA
ncbi:alkylhydroperoxidase/carboxymuconolactone decarboxylase family protein YurZ [Bradyrhizobium elkanii]